MSEHGDQQGHEQTVETGTNRATDRPKPAVAVVDAKTAGNVGTIARAMKNFGFEDLLLVDPPYLGRDSEAYGFAGQAREDILPNARELTFDELVEEFHTVGFTAITNEDASKHMRFPFRTPAALRESLTTVESQTALVFGRERVGLTNDEIARLDEVASIPASADYPVLNLGQAATVALYECRDLAMGQNQLPDIEVHRAEESRIEALYDHAEKFLGEIGYPVEKQDKTMRMLRRMLGRTHPTGREVNTLHGLLRRTENHVERAIQGEDENSSSTTSSEDNDGSSPEE